MSRNYEVNHLADIVNAIKNNYNETELDTEISKLEDLTTSTEEFMDSTGVIVTDWDNYNNDGTGYWDYDVTYGDATSVTSWRLDNYKDSYNQSRRELGFTLFKDNYNTINNKSDMDEYNKLIDGDSTSNISITYSDSTTEIFLEVEYPTDKITNLVKVNVEESDIKVYFAYSMNELNWTYLAGTTGDHDPSILTEYSSITEAQAAYILLDSGLNTFKFTNDIQMRYGKIIFVLDSGTNDATISLYNWVEQFYVDDLGAGTINTEYLVVSSPDGKTKFDGNSIIVKDSSNNVRVIIGALT